MKQFLKLIAIIMLIAGPARSQHVELTGQGYKVTVAVPPKEEKKKDPRVTLSQPREIKRVDAHLSVLPGGLKPSLDVLRRKSLDVDHVSSPPAVQRATANPQRPMVARKRAVLKNGLRPRSFEAVKAPRLQVAIAKAPHAPFNSRFERRSGVAGLKLASAIQQTFVVDDAGDAPANTVLLGSQLIPVFQPHTLRAAIQCANYTPETDEITFAIPTVAPASALPVIYQPIIIDGALSDSEGVILDGSNLPTPPFGVGYFGLVLTQSNNEILNLQVSNFPSGGIALNGSSNLIAGCLIQNNIGPGINFNHSSSNIIRGNQIGGQTGNGAYGLSLIESSANNLVDSNFVGTIDGVTAYPNERSGIYIESDDNIIQVNLISGNAYRGIDLNAGSTYFAKNVTIQDNYIGTTVSGDSALANEGGGISAMGGLNDNITDNVISGNYQFGISISNTVTGMTISQNKIGTTKDGMVAITNQYANIGSDGNNVLIENNIISGADGPGINLLGSNHTIQNNTIGLAADGFTWLGNYGGGIEVYGANNNITDNVISANGLFGIDIRGSEAQNNIVSENLIGTTAAGTSPRGNDYGVKILLSASDNFVVHNVISGNVVDGVYLGVAYGFSASYNTVQSNFIGTDLTASFPLPNWSYGVEIDRSWGNTIGGTMANDEGNIISSNLMGGIWIHEPASTYNEVLGNYVGIAQDGVTRLANGYAGIWIYQASHNSIGGNIETDGNTVSGNQSFGIDIEGSGAHDNVLQGNVIGLDASGETAVSNGDFGVVILNAGTNTVGDTSFVRGNIISGNDSGGVYILGDTSAQNIVRGNIIGLNFDGTAVVGHSDIGIFISGAPGNIVDGGNVISGNDYGVVISDSGAHGNVIDGNLIGTNAEGGAAIENQVGVALEGCFGNFIGSTFGNLISGNHSVGLGLEYADNNVIVRNTIGLNGAATAALPNGTEGLVLYASNGNTVGGVLAVDANTISGNAADGISIEEGSQHNVILRNIIGTDPTKNLVLGNQGSGVHVTGAADGYPSIGNTISANTISNNQLLGINLNSDGLTLNDALDADDGDNGLQNYPVLTLAIADTQISIGGYLPSYPNAQFRIEFFANDAVDNSGAGEGKEYLGSESVVTNSLGSGEFFVALPVAVPPGKFVTATATDSAGNTSEFSLATMVTSSDLFADVSVGISDHAEATDLADTLVYVMDIINHGPLVATNVVATDSLPSQLSTLSDIATRGIPQLSGGVFTLSIDTLHAGDTARVYLTMKVDSSRTIVHHVSVSANEPDPNHLNNSDSDTTRIGPLTATGNPTTGLPTSYTLSQNYPNPFNPSTTIRYELPQSSHVVLIVYNVLGEHVRTIVDQLQPAGVHQAIFNATDLSSGIYFYRIVAGEFNATRKLILLK